VTALLVAAEVGIGLRAMADGWEPFYAARLAVPRCKSPDAARALGLVLPAIAALGLAGLTAIQTTRNSLGVALASLACRLGVDLIVTRI
jgi:hypothetical protein